MHKRLFPKENQFTYRVYYVALPLCELGGASPLPINRPAMMNVREKDYGPRNGDSLEDWVQPILREHELDQTVRQVMLITMPRIFGYGFNPVSFWLCLDEAGDIRAVLCEVHNTFGEAHSYLCMHSDQRPIGRDDWLEAEKLFHVSPFLPREGSYHFRFAQTNDQLGIWIDYHDVHGQQQLLTSLIGKLEPLTKASLWRAFWTHPLVTLKTITLIHWQALKLFMKGVRYIVKPTQYDTVISRNLTKM